MLYAVLPPELTTAHIYSGPGVGPWTAASTAWLNLANESEQFIAGYAGTVTMLGSVWQGSAAEAMTAHAAAYMTVVSRLAVSALAASDAAALHAAAYNAVRAAITSPMAIYANREILLLLIATNILGQNTAAIADTEAAYEGFWAQNTASMNAYAATSKAATAQLQAPAADVAPSAAPSFPFLTGTGPVGSLVNNLFGLTPGEILYTTAEDLLSSGPYTLPTDILDLFSGLWAVSAPGTPLANALNAMSTAAATASSNVAVPAVPAAALPAGPVNVQVGSGNMIGNMSVPPSWAQPPQPPRPPIVRPILPRTPYQMGIPVPPAIPVLGGRSDQKRQKREDPEYGHVSGMLPPRHPSGG